MSSKLTDRKMSSKLADQNARGTLLYDTYKFAGHEEYVLYSQSVDAEPCPYILMIPPLFAEMNKMRSTLVEAMRILADHGVSSILPDLPGCHESIVPLNEQSFEHWVEAIKACATQHEISHVASFRGGSLLDDIGLPIWRLNSVKGANIIKTMLRSKMIAQKEAGQEATIDQLTAQATYSGIELAGYELSANMFSALQDTVPSINDNIFEIKVGQQLEGSTLWLRSEPEYDGVMAGSIAKSLHDWCTS